VRNRKLAQLLEHQGESLAAVLTVVTLSAPGANDPTTAAGLSVLQQVLSAPQLDQISANAHRALVQSVGEVFGSEKQRFLDLTESPDTLRAARDTLREAARQADYARHSDALDEETTT
jgi:hypothetical protein